MLSPTQGNGMNGNPDLTQHRLPKVTISILNWNGWRETIECLESVRQLHYPNFLIVVADNGSGDKSLEELRAWGKAHFREGDTFVEYPREVALAGGDPAREEGLERGASGKRLVLVDNRENLGFTGGNNVGIQYALRRPQPADYVLLFNNDATMDEGCLDHLLEAGRKAGAGIVGAVIKERESGHIQFAGYVGPFPLLRQFFPPLFGFRTVAPDMADEFQESFAVNGAAMLIRREVLEAVHLSTGYYLDDALFLYGDEADLCGRARKLGYKTVVANRALVYHGEASSMGGRANPFAFYYTSRNRIRLAGHLLPWPLRLPFHAVNGAVCAGRILKNLATRRPRAAFAIIQGLVDGYRGIGGRWRYHDRETQRFLAG